MTTSQIPAADAAPGVDAEELGRHIAEMHRAVAKGAVLLAVKPTEESSR